MLSSPSLGIVLVWTCKDTPTLKLERILGGIKLKLARWMLSEVFEILQPGQYILTETIGILMCVKKTHLLLVLSYLCE